MKKLTTKELRNILLEYSGGHCFNKTEKELRKWIRHNFLCSDYAVKTLAKEFTR